MATAWLSYDGPDISRGLWSRTMVGIGFALVAAFFCFVPSKGVAQTPDVETEWQYVVPPGVEDRVAALFKPYETGEAIGSGVFEKIIVAKDRVSAQVTNPDGSSAMILVRHPLSAQKGDRVFSSVSVSFPVSDGVGVDEAIAAVMAETIKKNDDGNFPWKKVFSKKAVYAETKAATEQGWEAGDSAEIWKLYLAWGLIFVLVLTLIFTRADLVRGWAREYPGEFWSAAAVVGVGVVLRVWIAPEALYKEAHHFRYLWLIGHPVGESVIMSSHYPAGLHFLYQIFHAITGAHPVQVLFAGNLFFGCCIPLMAAFLGWRLHRISSAPVIYAAVAAFWPHLVKYAHSEVVTGPQAAMLMAALWCGSLAHRNALFAGLSGLVMGCIATIRPEGFIVLPGLCLWMFAFALTRHGEERVGSTVRRGVFYVLGAVALAVFIGSDSMVRVYESEGGSGGIASEGLLLLGVEKGASLLTVCVAIIRRIFDPQWSAVVSPRFTPPPLLLLALVGIRWFIGRNRLSFFGLVVTYMGFAGVYAFFGSTLIHEGEMRYHLSMVPVVVVLAGAGAMELAAWLEAGYAPRRSTRVVVALTLACFLPYLDLVRAAEHPFQQEYLVLKEKVMKPALIDEESAMVFVPPANEKLIDIYPLSVAPLLSDARLSTNVTTWHPSKLSEAVGHLEDIPIYFYCGLYAHYLAGPEVNAEEWWEGRMTELGLGFDDSKSPYLKKIFEEERVFVPNHEVLDKAFADGVMKVALYQLVK